MAFELTLNVLLSIASRTVTCGSHCFRKKEISGLGKFLSRCSSVWASRGLNLGASDYESFCGVFHGIAYYANVLIFRN